MTASAIDRIASIAGVRARISELAVAPARVAELSERFTTKLAAASTATSAPAAGTTSATLPSGDDAPPANAVVTNSTSSRMGTLEVAGETRTSTAAPAVITSAAGAWRDAPVLGEARILRAPDPNFVAVASTSSVSLGATSGTVAAVTPRGTWVDRIPIRRGKELAPYIQGVADRYGLDPALLAAVFWTESGYQADVVSSAGAVGLGQLMPGTAATLGVDPWDPMQNMDGSARLYRRLIDKYGGDISLAISAYACGEGAVARAGNAVPSDFARGYITKLLGRRDYLAGTRAAPP